MENTLLKLFKKRRIRRIALLFIISFAILSVSPSLVGSGGVLNRYLGYRGDGSIKGFRDRSALSSRMGDRVGASAAEDGAKEPAEPKKPLVLIDPGHGGRDFGTCYGGLWEKEVVLQIALMTGELLEEAGVDVVYTRTEDREVELRSRPELANSIGADLLLSIHVNALEDMPRYKGTETLYANPGQNENKRVSSRMFAQIVQREVVNALGTDDNGVKNRSNLAVLRLAQMPAVIVELGYITNSSDRSKLAQPEYREKTAKALCKAVQDTLALIYPE